MGLYNFYWKGLPKPLGKGKCLLCESAILPQDRNPSRDAFQYVCANCNPNVLISISGSLIMSSLYPRLIKDQEVRGMLHREVQSLQKQDFALDTILISKMLQAHA